MMEYAVQVGDSDPQGLAAALNAMASNGFELEFVYDRGFTQALVKDAPLLIYSRELDTELD